MVLATIEFEIPKRLWTSDISRKHPKKDFVILSFLPLALTKGIALVRVEGDEVEQIFREIERHPSVVEASPQFKSEKKMILSVKTKGALPLKILLESEVILRPPIHVKGGIAKWNLITTHKKLRILTLLMRTLGFSFKIKSIKEYEEEELLTARQKEVLKHALKHGYYDTPRGISLTDLANKLDVSKSTLWEILRAIEKKLLCYEHVREKR